MEKKTEIIEVSLWQKIIDGAVKQGFSILLLLGGIVFLWMDRQEFKKENEACRARIEEIYRIVLEKDQNVINQNTQALNENTRTVRLYFHNLTEQQ